MNRVVITGQGTINSIGHNVQQTNFSMLSGISGIGELNLNNDQPLGLNIGAAVKDYNPNVYFDKNELNILDIFSQFALISAVEAIESSGINFTDELADNTGVIVGSAGGGLNTQEENYRLIFRDNKTRVHPFIVPKMMHNAAASNIAKRYNLKGVTYSVSSACASSNHAISNAYNLIKFGEATVMIAGGSDSMLTYGGLKAWEGLRVMSKTGCRPFCETRDGLVQGEGAAIFILEQYEHAVSRGANILAEILGCSMTSDGHDLVSPSKSGIKHAINKSLIDAKISADMIDFINAHGTATKKNDELEANILDSIFCHCERIPKVSSTKSIHGHVMGATGAIELLSCLLALRENVIAPTIGLVKKDPGLKVNLVMEEAQESKVEVVMSNSFAFGGLNSTIILGSI